MIFNLFFSSPLFSQNRRLASYLDGGKVVIGGKYNVEEKWMEPTVLVDVDEKSKVMTEEIFGPILPIINVKNHVDAIEFINKRWVVRCGLPLLGG